MLIGVLVERRISARFDGEDAEGIYRGTVRAAQWQLFPGTGGTFHMCLIFYIKRRLSGFPGQ
jgi:hypothetical protein